MQRLSIETKFERTQGEIERAVADSGGDRFLACNSIIDKANAILKRTGNSVLESEAVSWAATDEAPDDIEERIRQHRMASKPKTNYMKILLSYIDDEAVYRSVVNSYSESVKLNNIVFDYLSGMTKQQKTRVRVLTRMCWFNKYTY